MFLLRLGFTPPQGVNPWTLNHRKWLESIKFKHHVQQVCLAVHLRSIDEAKAKLAYLEKEIIPAVESIIDLKLLQALQALRGIGLITAATFVAEVGDFSRFKKPDQLMAFAGLVPSEYSTGTTRRQGKITKTGNSILRYIAVESSWHYRYLPKIGQALKKRQEGLSPEIIAIAWKAQQRLNHKYRSLLAKGKPKQKVITALGRELLGFVWAIANQVALESRNTKVA